MLSRANRFQEKDPNHAGESKVEFADPKSQPQRLKAQSLRGTAKAVPFQINGARAFPTLRLSNRTRGALHERETLAQIDSSDFWIVGQLAGLSLTEDSPVVDYVGPVGDAKRFANIVIGNEHSDTAGS